MTPDFDRAATAAAEILIKYGISTAPVDPIPIFKKADGFNVVTFAEMSQIIGMDRGALISSFDVSNHDAISSVYLKTGRSIILLRITCGFRITLSSVRLPARWVILSLGMMDPVRKTSGTRKRSVLLIIFCARVPSSTSSRNPAQRSPLKSSETRPDAMSAVLSACDISPLFMFPLN